MIITGITKLIYDWKKTAIELNRRSSLVDDIYAAEKIKQRADVYNNCAEQLRQAIKGVDIEIDTFTDMRNVMSSIYEKLYNFKISGII